ncbi:hypothetical protein EYZ11_012220 [Aspergillus tanneri]|uniref:PrpF protein n=1 Tax=Aspergillus tanneri TaxID=1220188 RepID=A0A4S3J667_9EURO|nr:hypothetical protein EYZ11_012220 [Aspergillus tanneri]
MVRVDTFSTASVRHGLQRSLPAAYYRGGTSRAVFFKKNDLPPHRSDWDEIFRRVLGSPDPNGRQLDGLGGGISSLSKVCVVDKSDRLDADVDYTFVSLGVKTSQVDYSSNCGNMISAVGPFAVDSQLVTVNSEGRSDAELRILNTNTGKIIRSRFPVVDGEADSSGSFAIDGVAGTGAKIQLDFLDPAGSRTGQMLPTGEVVNTFDGIRTTCIDVGNPCCFVLASELGFPGTITPDEIEAHPALLGRLDYIRRQAGVVMGLAEKPELVPGSVPKIGMVSAPDSTVVVDVVVRALSVGQPHRAVPITVALALAAAAKLPTSVVAEVTSPQPMHPAGITLGHASGSLIVRAEFKDDGSLSHATVFRTARRLMEGRVFWKG